jgi:putative PIN family toxin of toxin-antitoxin system
MRIVADTSTIVSGVLWSGLSHRIIELVEAGILTLCVTPEILQEYREVLARPKFARKLQDRLTTVEEIMQTLLPHVELYSDAPLVSAVQPPRRQYVSVLRPQRRCRISGQRRQSSPGSDRVR